MRPATVNTYVVAIVKSFLGFAHRVGYTRFKDHRGRAGLLHERKIFTAMDRGRVWNDPARARTRL